MGYVKVFFMCKGPERCEKEINPEKGMKRKYVSEDAAFTAHILQVYKANM